MIRLSLHPHRPREHMGLPLAKPRPVQAGAATVTLAPFSGRTGTRALRLTDAEGVDSWLEYRTATGRVVANWPGMAQEYGRRTRTLDRADYVA